MAGSLYKRCGCKVPLLDNDGQPVLDPAGRTRRKELGSTCPQLRRADGRWNPRHGTWWWLLQLPTAPDQQRQHLRQGGHASSDDAEKALRRVEDLLALAENTDDPSHYRLEITQLIRTTIRAKRPLPDLDELRGKLSLGQPVDSTLTVADWLTEWLAAKRDIAANTHRFYESNIRLYLIPHLGTRRLDRLRTAHLHAMFLAIEEQSLLTAEDNAARQAVDDARKLAWHDRDLPAVRAARARLQTMPPFRRPAGNSTLHGIRATLRTALTDATCQQLIPVNVAGFVKLPTLKRPKPKIWTPAHLTHWRETGDKPSTVMVWTTAQTAEFLQRSFNHPLFTLYRLVVFTGLRRGEACGLRWSDLDLDAATLSVNQQIVQLGWATQTGRPKSDAGERAIALDPDTVTLLGAHRRRQRKIRLAHGPGWLNTGLVFTDADGGPLHPAHVTAAFQQLIEEHDLPPIRLHDLRHGAATHALAAGVDARVVKETLGHSSTSFTRDTYQSVVDELKHQAAAALADVFNQAGARTWGTSSS
jgi:integrase